MPGSTIPCDTIRQGEAHGAKRVLIGSPQSRLRAIGVHDQVRVRERTQVLDANAMFYANAFRETKSLENFQ